MSVVQQIYWLVFYLVLCINLIECMTMITHHAEESQLISAHVVFRHGDRNLMPPVYPTSLYKNESFWPGGEGALTTLGKSEQYELGKYLRRRYEKLLGTRYSPDNVYIRSTDEDRNLMSTECTVAGLFPPSEDEIWNDKLKWQPIPIHTKPLDEDYLLNSFVDCARWDQQYQQRLESEEVSSLMEIHKPLLEFMQQKSGMKLESVVDVWFLFSGLLVENRRGYLTDWATEALKSKDILEYISAVSYQSVTYTSEMKKQRAGFLIKEILDHFTNKTKSLLKPDRSFWIYAIHSTGMANILNSLSVFEELHIPPLSSSILFELHKQDREYYVQVFYRKTVTEDASPLVIPKCGSKCPLAKFYEIYKDIIPTEYEDFNSLCQSS